MRLVPDGGADGARERGAAELPLPLRLFPVLSLTVPFHHLGLISSASFAHTVWLLFVVWNGDTGALVSGRAGRMLAGAAGDPLAALFPRQVVGAVRRISPP